MTTTVPVSTNVGNLVEKFQAKSSIVVDDDSSMLSLKASRRKSAPQLMTRTLSSVSMASTLSDCSSSAIPSLFREAEEVYSMLSPKASRRRKSAPSPLTPRNSKSVSSECGSVSSAVQESSMLSPKSASRKSLSSQRRSNASAKQVQANGEVSLSEVTTLSPPELCRLDSECSALDNSNDSLRSFGVAVEGKSPAKLTDDDDEQLELSLSSLQREKDEKKAATQDNDKREQYRNSPVRLRSSFRRKSNGDDDDEFDTSNHSTLKRNSSVKWSMAGDESKLLSPLHDSRIGFMFYTDEEMAEFRYEAFCESCGLDVEDYK